ncbi:unnamed protein product [Allacma fusca]|uniref:Uncharacterized protein n=1 Tax=Allacma fusca TaxID=39272 RepID=A0A8J2JSB0_9HEXA|nr:unnamed protein product [Allacma fusca]
MSGDMRGRAGHPDVDRRGAMHLHWQDNPKTYFSPAECFKGQDLWKGDEYGVESLVAKMSMIDVGLSGEDTELVREKAQRKFKGKLAKVLDNFAESAGESR